MAEVKLSLSPFMGLDTYSHTNLMKDGYSPDCRNVETEAGILRSSKGFARIKEKNGCRMVFDHYKSNGSVVRLVMRNGNIESFEDGKILRSAYYTDGDNISMVNYQLNNTYITVICNGKTAPVKYNGSAISVLGGSPPACAFAELHNERLFLAGSSSNPDRVYYSSSFDPESWNEEIESGYIDLPSWDGGRIKEIKSVFGDLVVFKDYGLYRIYGTYPGEFGVEKISSNVGCINKNTIAVNGDSCYFLNHKGLCLYNGLSAKPVENKRLKALIDNMDFSRVDEARIYDCFGKLYMFLPMGDEDCVIEYDYTDGTILKKTGYKVRQFLSDKDGMYIIDGNGYVCKFNEGNTYDGADADCYWRSRDYDLGSKSDIKNVLHLCVSARGEGTMKVCIRTEREVCEREAVLTEGWSFHRIPIRVRGRTFYVELSKKDGGSFELESPYLYIDLEEE